MKGARHHWPEAGYGETFDHLGDQPEEKAIDDEGKQAQRDEVEGQRHENQGRSKECVEYPQKEGCDSNSQRMGDFDSPDGVDHNQEGEELIPQRMRNPLI